MEIAELAPVGNASNVVDGAVIPRLHLVGIFDHLVNEVAEVKHKIELVARGGAFIFVNHAAVGVEGTLVDILTAHECEVHCARIVWQRRSDSAANAAAVSVAVGKPIPVGTRRLESANQNARGPVGSA